MSRYLIAFALPVVVFMFVAAVHLPAQQEKARTQKNKDDGYKSIFDGKTLKGWRISAKTGHSRKSKHKSGGKWVVKNGAIIGSQDIPGNGGIIITDKMDYGDFEVVLEMNNDFIPCSGLFLRSNERGQCYQAMIDYHKGGNLMGIYGEGLGGKPHVRNFDFTDKVTEIKPRKSPFPLPIKPKDWAKFWKHGEWNELKARIVGDPPTITTWIKGVKFMHYKDTKKRHQRRGGIALQVHGGNDYTKVFVRYRKIKVKILDKK